MEINAGIFKSYDVRGIYPNEIDLPVVKRITQTFWRLVLEKSGHLSKARTIVLARDGRNSSPDIAKAIRETLLELGAEVYDLGAVSINEMYFAIGEQECAGGIMATASHNPPEYGGLKMVLGCRPETGALEFVGGKDIFQLLAPDSEIETPANNPGKLQEFSISEKYLAWILEKIADQKIKPFKIVLDAGNGMAGGMAKKLLEKMGCQIFDLFLEPDGNFPNRNPNPLVSGAVVQCGQMIREKQADFGVMFDADGDRLFLVDEQGKLVGGDMTLLLIAKTALLQNPGAGVVYNLICSHAVPELVNKWGGRAIRSEVGYRNLARHMLQEKGILSGEVSGHFAFKDHFYTDSAFLALALVVGALSQNEQKISQIIAEQTLYYRGSEVNLTVSDTITPIKLLKDKYQASVRDEIDGLTVEFPDWWFNARPSNTEPILRLTIEARNQVEWEQHKNELLEIIS